MSIKGENNLKEYTDLELTQLIKKGDNRAFEEMLVRYIKLISLIAGKYKIESYEPGDFMQEGLLGLLSACKTYNPDSRSSLKNYICICVENRFKTILKKATAQKSIPTGNLVSLDEINCEYDSSLDPQEIFQSNQHLQGYLNKIKNTLSPFEFKVFSLYFSGYTHNEIASHLEVTAKSVDNALQRIKKKSNS